MPLFSSPLTIRAFSFLTSQCECGVREVGHEPSTDRGLQRGRAHGRSLAGRDLTQVIVAFLFGIVELLNCFGPRFVDKNRRV